MDWHYVIELVKSIRNRCEIIDILALDWDEEVEKLMPTLLEDILQDAQDAVDEACVVPPTDDSWATSPWSDGSITLTTDNVTYHGFNPS